MPLRDLIDDRALLFPLNVDQYHQMIRTGILPEGEPYELLDGLLIRKDRSKAGEDPMTVGKEHAYVISAVMEVNPKFRRLGCHVRIQLPLTLVPKHEPEPDAAIVVGAFADYLGGHPTPPNILCAIEISDSSLLRDRTRKLRIYATSGIPLYVILNLPDRVAEVYSHPDEATGRYRQSTTLSRGQALELPTAGSKQIRVPLRKLLPR